MVTTTTATTMPAVVAPTPAQANAMQLPPVNGKHAHVRAWRALSKVAGAAFGPNVVLALTGTTSCWQKPTTDGYVFFTQVLLPLCGNGNTATVAQVVAKAATIKHGNAKVLSQLAWLYTAGPYVTANGLHWPNVPALVAPVVPAPVVAAPVQAAKPAKAKAKA